MATKTFEELKQMAIQIRDEKANKQNTATRIGTQMLEHLNKLEQDFLDKDTTEGKFSELELKSLVDEIEQIDDMYIDINTGQWTKSAYTGLTISKKYIIKKGIDYYAFGRTGTTGKLALVTYFDKNEKFIGYEYPRLEEARVYENVKLNIPNEAYSLVLLGTTKTGTSQNPFPPFLKAGYAEYPERLFKKVSPIEIYDGYYDTELNDFTGISSKTEKYIVNEGETYYINFRIGPTAPSSFYGICIFNSENNLIYKIYQAEGIEVIRFAATVEMPENASYMYVCTSRSGEYPEFISGVNIKCEIKDFALLSDIDKAKEKILRLLRPIEILNDKAINIITGEIEELATQYNGAFVTNKYKIVPNKKYYVCGREGSTSTTRAIVVFVDENMSIVDTLYTYTGIAYKIVYGEIIAPTSASYVYVFGATGNIQTDAKQSPELYVLDKDIDTLNNNKPEDIQYYISPINNNIYKPIIDDNICIEKEIVQSAWAMRLPKSYTDNGEPTQLIFMLHGSSGFVSMNCMGYNTEAWLNWQQAYLNAGFGIIDVNGRGISTQSDEYSRHFGCPIAVETLKTAFEYVKKVYNVNKKVMIHATSMGGTLATSYILTYPQDVICYAGFAPASVLNSAKNISSSLEYLKEYLSKSWGYNTYQEMVDDNYSNMCGYELFMRTNFFNNEGNIQKINWKDIDVNELYNDKYYTRCEFPIPIRIWSGSEDATVPVALQKFVIQSLRNAGCNATLRLWTGVGHELSSGIIKEIYIEAIDFFKKYLP